MPEAGGFCASACVHRLSEGPGQFPVPAVFLSRRKPPATCASPRTPESTQAPTTESEWFESRSHHLWPPVGVVRARGHQWGGPRATAGSAS